MYTTENRITYRGVDFSPSLVDLPDKPSGVLVVAAGLVLRFDPRASTAGGSRLARPSQLDITVEHSRL